jgi:glutathione S-transferase
MHTSVALVTLLALFVYVWTLARAGQARGKFGVEAPATTGHPEFERHFRVQANTLEGIVIFLPALWVFAIFSSQDLIAAGLGLVWIVGRVVYALGYAKEPKARSAGFGIQALACVALLLGGLGFVIMQIVKHGF